MNLHLDFSHSSTTLVVVFSHSFLQLNKQRYVIDTLRRITYEDLQIQRTIDNQEPNQTSNLDSIVNR